MFSLTDNCYFLKKKKDTDNSLAKIHTVTEDEESKETIEAVTGKKRKRKKTSSGTFYYSMSSSFVVLPILFISLLFHFYDCIKEAVDGFSVFRSSTSKSNEEGQADDDDDGSIRLKKEQNKQLEV